ncbi:MAG: ABC transporter permease subunit [Myxococcota bacterium]|nr:ABC transporter permease subunit [Myxococcota bacterium]
MRKTARLGLYLSGALVVCILIAGLVSPFVEYIPEDHVTPGGEFKGVSLAHLLGTDFQGRDVAIRLLKGTEAFFFPGIIAALLATGLGGLGGAISGYNQGPLRAFVIGANRLVDTLPRLVFIILVCSVVGEPSIYLIATVTGLLFVPTMSTVIRRRVETLASADYILAHIAHGFRPVRILLYHILWLQCRPLIFRQATYVFCYVLFIETALSYLGHYGVQEPVPSWGNMVEQAKHGHPSMLPWLAPAVAIVVTIASFLGFGNLIAEFDEEEVR